MNMTDNFLELGFGNSHVSIRLEEGCRLTALASALEYGLIWLTGRGVWRFEAIRQGHVIILKTLAEASTCRQGGSGRFVDVIPNAIPAAEVWHTSQLDQGESIVQCSIQEPELTIEGYSFAISESLMSLFLIGSTHIRHQCGTSKFQTRFNVALPDEAARAKLFDKYDPFALVKDAFAERAESHSRGVRDGQHRTKAPVVREGQSRKM
jgi:hypothetical protein